MQKPLESQFPNKDSIHLNSHCKIFELENISHFLNLFLPILVLDQFHLRVVGEQMEILLE